MHLIHCHCPTVKSNSISKKDTCSDAFDFLAIRRRDSRSRVWIVMNFQVTSLLERWDWKILEHLILLFRLAAQPNRNDILVEL